MVNIIKEEQSLEESLRKKIEFICDFTNNKPTIINGSIRKIDKTNLTYIEPHRIIINNTTFLAFNYSNEIFIENLSNKIKLSELAYSLHLGSDKNRKNISKQNGKNNLSGTTSLPNNAIQNVRQLSKVDKHNYRKYDDNQELIEIVRGTSSPLNDVKEFYLSEFEEARLEYNSKQTRPSRMIDNYFDNVSNNEKKDLACEIILELGDKEYWDTKDENFKKKMSEVYKKQVDDLELLAPNFKVASAIIHYDETSPHMHIVGVPIKYKNKNGMEKQVGKSDVFTKESLIRLQDKMRTLCIEEFNQVYSLDSTLNQKQKGRNRDIHVSDMDNYIEMKKQIEKNTKNLK